MDTILLAIQARVLMWVGLAYVVAGLWLGNDPLSIAWRAPAAAVAAMIVAGWLLRQVAAVVQERAAADMAERQLATEQAAQAAIQAQAQPATQLAAARMRQAQPARAAR
jgi:hypothetical protein